MKCLLIGLFLVISCKSQETEDKVNKWVIPELPDSLHAELCHKQFIRFWRLTLDGHKGNWHLYNDEDKRFLGDMQVRIYKGQYVNTKIEWLAMEGKLPK